MTAGIVILDTNVLPINGNFDSRFWRALSHLCSVKDLRLSVADITLHESINLKMAEAEAWIDSLRKSYRRLGEIVSMQPIYIPSIEELSAKWEAAIRARFDVIEVDGADACEALRREALRILPAQRGVGARDSAIWLTAKRLAAEGSSVMLVTNNTGDFGKGSLHANLADELSGMDDRLVYLTSLQALIETMAAKVSNPQISVAQAAEILTDSARSHALDLLEQSEFENLIAEDVLNAELIFGDIVVYSTYVLDDRGLSNLGGKLELRESSSDSLLAAAEFEAWVEFDLATGQFAKGDVGDLVLAEETSGLE
jgi:hypothetical protein